MSNGKGSTRNRRAVITVDDEKIFVIYGEATRARMAEAEIQHRTAADAIREDLNRNKRLRTSKGRPAAYKISQEIFNKRREEGVPLPLGRSGRMTEAHEIGKRWPKSTGVPKRPTDETISERHIAQLYKQYSPDKFAG